LTNFLNLLYLFLNHKDSEDWLSEHNSGTNKFTYQNRSWKLIYSETFLTKSEALKKEIFLKSGQGRKWLDEKLSNQPNIQG